MPRQLTLCRTEAEWLVDLLEACDPKQVGTWRHSMAADVRQLFGMCSLEEEKRRAASQSVGEPEMFEDKPTEWVTIVPADLVEETNNT